MNKLKFADHIINLNETGHDVEWMRF